MRESNYEERSWCDFTEAGLFWWVNRSLHLFGWAIVREEDDHGMILRVYPARCRVRGFSPDADARGFERLTRHIAERAEQLVADLESQTE